jgi:hypothetical protein
MKTLSIPGIWSASKIAVSLLINSFLLGPLAIVYGLIAEALLTTHRSVLFAQTNLAMWAILAGGFFCSFACMAASIGILLPIAIYELNSQSSLSNGIALFKKYLPVPVLLALGMGLMINISAEFKPFTKELLSIILSFYLTASTGLYLLSRQLATTP